MSHLAADPVAGDRFQNNFSQLDQTTRRDIFRYLRDDLQSAAEFAMSFPRQLFLFLGALIVVPHFAPHVTSVNLSSPFDDPGESGFWEFLLAFGDMPLPPGHFALPVQNVGEAFIDECEDEGLATVDGILQGSELIPPEWHWGTLIGSILPVLCPNLVALEIPASWGAAVEVSARANLPNLQTVRRT
ncbi:hypothetical protein BDU57DRAFT_501541 [Ampelomyces quisqualis]|uniref:Uncharacterized protein n=1 Tax=Ampelomyces quisqualis TaxID=50730 RepID=A0A6A5QGH0_AMPQU|nr:hypothetical protein BDU57DRAFT_501541 [Ampelomyces quisqualis]